MRVLIASAQTTAIRQAFLALSAAQAGIDEAAGVEETLELADLYPHDIIILGPVLEDAAALDVLRRLRAAGVETPAIWLCGDASADEQIRALDLGADDCVRRGFGIDELLARVRAVVRRAAGHATAVLRVGPLSIDTAARAVTYEGQPVHITGKEYGILELLALRRGAVVRRETIMDHLYAGRDEPVFKVIDIHICRIRRKLARVAPGEPLLRTVWGQGFALGWPQGAPGLAMAA